mmetsp:Transcript_32516/g.35002  ORF Transcript_32516/g.35002 Transcript_32516/m.35002 type:complete len:107 (+) Transcript_32516:322-642(+)
MIERGQINHILRKLFITQSEKAQKSKLPHVSRYPPTYISNNNKTETRRLFVHVPHHPNNLAHNKLKSITNKLKKEINKEREKDHELERIITAYSKATNIADFCNKH